MKKYIIYLLQLAVFPVMLSGCYNDHDEALPSYSTEAALPEITTVSTPSIINSTDIDNSQIGFSFTIDSEHVESVAVFRNRIYREGGNIVTSNEVEHATISTFPADVSVSAAEAVQGLGVSADELQVGDLINFYFRVTLKNGTVLNSGSVVSFPVSCISEIPTEGTWTAVTNSDLGSSTNPNVTLTANGDGAYSISDVSAGVYNTCCGFNVNQPATFSDVCNSITITGSAGSQFSIGSGGTGSWNPETETLTIAWYDSGNALGGTTIFTRN